MKTLYEEIKKHIESSSEEQIQEDWNELKKYNDIGPFALDILNNKIKK